MPPPTSEAGSSVLRAAATAAAAGETGAGPSSDAAIDGRLRPVTPHSMTLTSALRANGTFEPVVCTNYERDGPQFSGVAGHVGWRIHDCLRATSAVPLMWPPYRVAGREYFGERGSRYVHDPSKACLLYLSLAESPRLSLLPTP